LEEDEVLAQARKTVGSPLPVRIPGALLPWLVAAALVHWEGALGWALFSLAALDGALGALQYARITAPLDKGPRAFFSNLSRWNRINNWLCYQPTCDAGTAERRIFAVLLSGLLALVPAIILYLVDVHEARRLSRTGRRDSMTPPKARPIPKLSSNLTTLGR